MLGESNKSDERAERFGDRAPAEEGPVTIEAAFDPRAARTPLSTADCRKELERLGITLHEGMPLRLRNDDHEVAAIAYWDAEWGGYMAAYDAQPAPTPAEPQAT